MSPVTRVPMPPENRPSTLMYARVTSKLLKWFAVSPVLYWYCTYATPPTVTCACAPRANNTPAARARTERRTIARCTGRIEVAPWYRRVSLLPRVVNMRLLRNGESGDHVTDV